MTEKRRETTHIRSLESPLENRDCVILSGNIDKALGTASRRSAKPSRVFCKQ
jgi:hypothetical protein